MATFDECIEKAKKTVDEWGDTILKATIQTRHGIIEIRYFMGFGYKMEFSEK